MPDDRPASSAVDLAPYYADDLVTLYKGDALAVLTHLPSGSVDCIVTSPPYFGLRDYGIDGQYGLESSPAEYVATMRALFAEARRVLADDGTLWLNIGDSYSVGPVARHNTNRPNANRDGSRDTTFETFGAQFRPGAETHGIPAKNLLGVPWRVAFALQDDGWTLRNAIVWHKPNAMPESVTDRLSGDYEHVFMLSKSRTYHFDLDAIREPITHADCRGPRDDVIGQDATNYAPGVRPQTGRHRTGNRRKYIGSDLGRNPGSVWDIPTQPFGEAHFAVMPSALARRCVSAGCRPGGVVLDPFSGSGTTGAAATSLGRRYIGVDLNAEYLDLSLRTRLAQSALCDAPQESALDETGAA